MRPRKVSKAEPARSRSRLPNIRLVFAKCMSCRNHLVRAAECRRRAVSQATVAILSSEICQESILTSEGYSFGSLNVGRARRWRLRSHRGVPHRFRSFACAAAPCSSHAERSAMDYRDVPSTPASLKSFFQSLISRSNASFAVPLSATT